MALYRFYRFASRFLPEEGDFPAGPYLWFHGSSIGEIRALLPLAVLFSNNMPVMFSSNTQAGIRACGGFRCIRFWDNPRFVKKGLSGAKALIIAESELWPNLLMSARSMGIPAFLANARVNRGTRRWLLAKGVLVQMLSAFTEIYPKDEREAAKIAELGAQKERIICLGGLKFDALPRSTEAKRGDFGFAGDVPLITFGSVRSREFGVVAEAIARLDGFQIAIAPRHRDKLGKLLRELRGRGLSFRLRTEGGGGRVLVLDTIGELNALYSASDLAFVGGTLAPYGGHNILEPAALGVPVLFGPHYENQPSEAKGLISVGGAVMIRGPEDLASAARSLLSDRASRAEMGEKARAFVERNRGASRRIYERIMGFLMCY
ncbi:MAG: glycosyltransferase N-terminal domain-containing protein [candidate division WOR-3 bacterium]